MLMVEMPQFWIDLNPADGFLAPIDLFGARWRCGAASSFKAVFEFLLQIAGLKFLILVVS